MNPPHQLSVRVREFSWDTWKRYFEIGDRTIQIVDMPDSPEAFQSFVLRNLDFITDQIVLQAILDVQRIKENPELWLDKYWQGRKEQDSWNLREVNSKDEFLGETLDQVSYKGVEWYNKTLSYLSNE